MTVRIPLKYFITHFKKYDCEKMLLQHSLDNNYKKVQPDFTKKKAIHPRHVEKNQIWLTLQGDSRVTFV